LRLASTSVLLEGQVHDYHPEQHEDSRLSRLEVMRVDVLADLQQIDSR
jgi:hypothetical protein